ncbi:phage tail sheath family protein [Paenibacillus sp. GCM10027626]|uniref:phage tail sheath family protein n=1 Tax=Paenibacillus sp. GCM10027626 TaxID=3273411 RepID=UPI003638BC06
MAYKHGVYTQEVSSAVVPAVSAAIVPVVFGTAPINLTKLEAAPVNKPILCFTYGEAVEAFGYSNDWSFTLCEFMNSHFSLFEASPVVLVNVLDPGKQKKAVPADKVSLVKDVATVKAQGIIASTLIVKSDDEASTYEKGKDYEANFDNDGNLVIQRIAAGTIPANTSSLSVEYDKLDPSAVTAADVIGGVDKDGNYTGLELIDQIFPRFRFVPGMVLAPGYSTDPSVAAVMTAKVSNINGHFESISLTDIPTDKVKSYTEAPAWKNDNNYTSPLQIAGYPKVLLGDKQYHLSTQLAGIMAVTDAANDDIPYVSPSNQNLQATGAVLQDGTEVFLGPDQAAYLNGQGIVTALNFIGGWKAWGNRTGAYPAITDPKDSFIPVRRMMTWIKNTIILTYWSKVDAPGDRRLTATITDSLNQWFNGLAAQGYLLGGRVEFNESENPEVDLMDGKVKFHVYATPPSPAREIDFIVEYDAKYLAAVFGA